MEFVFAFIMGWQAGNWHQANKAAHAGGFPEFTLGPKFYALLTISGIFTGWLTILPGALIVAFVGSGGWLAFGLFLGASLIGAIFAGLPWLNFAQRVYFACAAPVISVGILISLYLMVR